jgi:hypothetical protein
MTDKIKRTLTVLAALVALALGGAAIAAATGGGSGADQPAAQSSPVPDNHADGETNDDNGAAAKDKAEQGGESPGDADGSPRAEASE